VILVEPVLYSFNSARGWSVKAQNLAVEIECFICMRIMSSIMMPTRMSVVLTVILERLSEGVLIEGSFQITQSVAEVENVA
jgi:hypothetical protein